MFSKTKLTADAGFHTEANMKMLADENIDGYVADILFRKRDPRFADYRQVYFFVGRSKEGRETYTQKMKRKIDSDRGRLIYSKRIGTAEPVFANLRNALGLSRFTLRGNQKVNIQWKLYCIVHNLLKVHRFGPGFT